MFTKYLDPKNDVAFKKIFGTEKNKDILLHFLNDMINFRGDGPIVDVTFLKTVQDPETAAKKTSIVDILCKDEKGNQYIVEMQVAKEKGFEKRAQYYASKAYISQANKGGEYHNLKEVIFLAISDFVMFPKKAAFKSDHVILDKDNHDHDLKDFSFTFLELPKFNKNIDDLDPDNMIEKWAYFFKNAESTTLEDREKLHDEDGVLDKAYDQLNRMSWNDEEFYAYEQEEKRIWDNIAVLAQKLDEGIALGRVEGKAEEKINIVRSMMSKNYAISVIADITGLSEEEIKKIGPKRSELS